MCSFLTLGIDCRIPILNIRSWLQTARRSTALSAAGTVARLIEVKSTTDLKGHHLEDVAIQYRVLRRSGLDVASACMAHINRGCVFDGDSIDVRQFFKVPPSNLLSLCFQYMTNANSVRIS